jgi:hypothetical protein
MTTLEKKLSDAVSDFEEKQTVSIVFEVVAFQRSKAEAVSLIFFLVKLAFFRSYGLQK